MNKKFKMIFGAAIAALLLASCAGEPKLPPLSEEEYASITPFLNVNNGELIYGNVYLPSLVKGAAITWKSSNPDVISGEKIGEKQPGVVNRTNEEVTVTLTAVIEKDGCRSEFAQDVKVAKLEKVLTDDDYQAYLFGHFVGESYGKTENGQKVATGEQMFFALADVGQGLKFKDLNGSRMNNLKPVLSSNVGERGVRDPFICRSPEGDTFYLIATDLSVYTRNGWNSNNGSTKFTITGSHSITLWESHDLVNWTDARLIQVARDDAGMAWAPEMIYNEELGEYVIFFSSTILNQERNAIVERDCIYYCTTRDFRHFSETKKFLKNQDYPEGQSDSRADASEINKNQRKIIDASVFKYNGWYYCAAKDGDNHESNGGILIQKTQNLLDIDSWQKVMDLDDTGFKTFNNRTPDNTCMEGPEWFLLNKADRVDPNVVEIGLMTDFYADTSKGYVPFTTTNIEDATNANGSWRKLEQNTDYSWDAQTKRHGTILRITQEEAERLKAAYPIG